MSDQHLDITVPQGVNHSAEPTVTSPGLKHKSLVNEACSTHPTKRPRNFPPQSISRRLHSPPPYRPVSPYLDTPTKLKDGLVDSEIDSTVGSPARIPTFIEGSSTSPMPRIRRREKSDHETQPRLLVGHFNTNHESTTPTLLPIYIYFATPMRTRKPIYFYTLSPSPNSADPPSGITEAQYKVLGFSRQSKSSSKNQQADIEPWVTFDQAFQIGPKMQRFTNWKDQRYKRFWVEYRKLDESWKKNAKGNMTVEGATGSRSELGYAGSGGISGGMNDMGGGNYGVSDDIFGTSGGGYGIDFAPPTLGTSTHGGSSYDSTSCTSANLAYQPLILEKAHINLSDSGGPFDCEEADLADPLNMGDTETS